MQHVATIGHDFREFYDICKRLSSTQAPKYYRGFINKPYGARWRYRPKLLVVSDGLALNHLAWFACQ